MPTAAQRNKTFFKRGLPFLALVAAGSWAIANFLKLPVQLKDDARRRKKLGTEKFDLNREHQRLQTALQAEAQGYENVRVPGPKNPNRKPAD